ncbi:efflux RND transporter periplasmic adaptor subunit [bacterium]|nr:efflux RND transporter periplasmic adaptor subunit [bacterium]
MPERHEEHAATPEAHLHDAGEKGHEEHAGTPEGAHEEHAEGEGEQVVSLPGNELGRLGIRIAEATAGTLTTHVEFPGEVRLNEDALIHVVPRIGGIVREVRATLGDRVRQDDVLAVLESRDLADLKAEYLAARERVELRQATFEREKELFEKQLTPEQDYLEARQAVREAQIQMTAVEQKLHAVGFAEKYLKSLPSHPDAALTLYDLTAPADGTIIEKHITRGEVLEETSQPFTIADLSTVWIDLKVYQRNIPQVRRGQTVRITAGEGVEPSTGVISYIGPVVGEETRTSLARVVLPNPDGRWRAGMFITGQVAAGRTSVPVVVLKTAIQTIEDRRVVFVRSDEGFHPRTVQLGREDADQMEVLEGLQPGQQYAATGAFILKAELVKGSIDPHAGHSH